MTAHAVLQRFTSRDEHVSLSTGQRSRMAVDVLGDLDDLAEGGAVPVWLVLAGTTADGLRERTEAGPGPAGVGYPAVVITLSLEAILPRHAMEADESRQAPADLSQELSAILVSLHHALARELLLVGGGAAGEEALRQSAALGPVASCLAWSLPPWSDRRHDNGSATGERASWGRRTVILQDATDPGVRNSLGPRARALSYVHRGRGLHTTDSGHCAIVVPFGTGDRMPSAALIRMAITELADTSRPGRAVFSALEREGLIDPSTAFRLPRDLRHDAGALLADASIEADPVAGRVQRVRITGFRPGTAGLTFEFRLVSVSGAPLHDFEPVTTGSPTATLPADVGGLLEVAVVDGFGNRVQTMRSRWPLRQPADRPTGTPLAFVYGSCVTRDAFTLPGAPGLADYVARSPLGSAFSMPTDTQGLIKLEDNPSAFQRRMVAADFDKRLARLLSDTPFDLLLIDFIDERLSMLRTGAGYVTDSSEARRCGLRPRAADLVRPGSAEHVAAFTAGLDGLLTAVPTHRILVNKVYWSSTTTRGEKLPDTELIQENNAILDTLYGVAADRGLRFLGYPESVFVSDPDHKWGLSPFHYAAPLYEHTLQGISAAHGALV